MRGREGERQRLTGWGETEREAETERDRQTDREGRDIDTQTENSASDTHGDDRPRHATGRFGFVHQPATPAVWT